MTIKKYLVWPLTILGIAIIAAITTIFIVTRNVEVLWWVLILTPTGLMFLLDNEDADPIKTQCPKCDHKFTAMEAEED